MAGGIKGITVKIGGDTTELGKALKDATTSSKSLQSELKGVNSLLKMDPSNVTLLTQKSDLLKKSIEETKNKQEALNEVLNKVESGEIEMTEEEYRNLQREIALTDNKLEDLEKEFKDFGSVGAQQIAQVGEKVQEAGGKIEEAGKKLSVLSGATGAVLGGSVILASNFTDAMAKVNTIADTSAVSLEDLSAQILELSNQTGISAEEIADATYNAISAGQDTADAVTFVANATSLAKAGFTDTGSAIDILTTIMNAYGLEASAVGNVSDMLIQTQNKGKTTVAELASTMGKIIPTANAFGVSLDQLCAGYSIMTANGIATAESTTYMNSMLNELGKSSSKVSGVLKEETGQSFQELMESGSSLGDVLQILQDHATEAGIGFNDLWSSSEAGKAGLTLLSGGVDAFNEAVDGMNGSVGSTSEAMDKLETPSQKAKVALNQLKNSGIELGTTALTALTPLIDKVCDSVTRLTEWFSNLSPTMQKVILGILAVITAIGPLLIVIGKVTTGVGGIMKMAPKISSLFSSIGAGAVASLGPILAIVAVIAILTGAFIHLWKTNEDFRNKMTEIWDGLKQKFQDFTQGITDRINALGFDFENITEVIKAIWNTFCEFLAPVFEGIWNQVTNILSFAMDLITSILDIFIGLFTGNWEQCWNGVKELFVGIWNFIKGTFESWAIAFRGIADKILGWFGTSWSEIWTNAKNTISNILGGIKSFISNTFNNIKTTITTVFNGIKTVTTTVWNAIKTAITNPIESAKNIIKGIIDTIKGFFNFRITWPTIPMPHFSISPSGWKIGDLLKGSIPSLGIKWYADGGIFDSPTIIPTLKGLKGVGEAGPEAVTPINKLMSYIETAVNDSSMDARLANIEDMISAYLPGMANRQVVLDSGELVGGLVAPLDSAMSARNTKISRGW